jgi:hypothetical protein
MKTRQILSALCLFFSLCCLPLTGIAQQDALPESRWTLGLEFGLPLILDCELCSERNTLSTTLGINATYRIRRWLGVNFNSSYYNMNLTKHEWFGSFGFHTSDAFLRTNAFNLSIGPQLLFRIGQGDLSLEARYGWVLNYTRMSGYDSKGGSFTNETSTLSSGTSAFRIAYTYWPKHRFGIQLGVETANNQFPDATVLLINQQYNEQFNTQLVSSRGFSQLNLIIGANYRF